MPAQGNRDRPVIVAGGGIGGLSAALALARKGVSSLVLEQAGSFGEIGAGIQLAPNAWLALDRLGVREAAARTAVFIDRLIMMDSLNGREAGSIELGERIRRRFGQPYAVIHRADLHRAILEACEAEPLVDLRTSRQVVRYVQDAGGVTARTAEGESFAGAALIGADGLWSQIRAQMLRDGKPDVSGHIAYRAVLPLEEFPEELRWNAATLWAGPRTHLVHYPLRNWKLFNIVATFHSDAYVEGWNEPGDRDELLYRFRDVGARPLSILTRPDSWRRWVLCDRKPVDTWSDGRVTLLGDAAHPMLQYFAQGACMAMEDAIVLADRLEAAGGDFAAAFPAYQAERAPRTARVQLQARKLGELYHMSGIRRLIRNWMLRRRPAERYYDGLAWLYGGPGEGGAQGQDGAGA